MRLSVRALRRARPELFVNYISGAFIAPEPQTTEMPPPPPQTASLTPGAPASRRPGCEGSAGPEVSSSPTRDLTPEKGRESPAWEVRSRHAVQVRQGAWVGRTRQRPARTSESGDQGLSASTPRLLCRSPWPWATHLGNQEVSTGSAALCEATWDTEVWEPQGLGEGTSQRTQPSPA